MESNLELKNNQPLIKTIITIIKLIVDIAKARSTGNIQALEDLKNTLTQTYGLIALSRDILKTH
jgi:hypothetical protein